SSRRRHTRFSRDWSSDVCSSDLVPQVQHQGAGADGRLRDLPELRLFEMRLSTTGIAALAIALAWPAGGDAAVKDLAQGKAAGARSEERRVGRECTSRGATAAQ